MDETNRTLRTMRLEPVWQVVVELADRDDARVRAAVTGAVGLRYGAYSGVCYEGAAGLQFFVPEEGSRLGDGEAVEMPVRVLRFSVPRETAVLVAALEAIRETHSYEEPVIHVTEAWVSRAIYGGDRDNSNRWWNRGFDK